MSKIDELIQQLCPNGVEYKELGSAFHISRGRVISKDYLRENGGVYPVYSSQTANHGEIGKIKTYDYSGEYLTWTTDGANAGTVFYRNGKFSITNVCGLLKSKSKEINNKFVYYILCVIMKSFVSTGMGNPKLMSNVVERIPIPIPPLEIQEEIVRILDNFSKLEAELEAELEARNKQYEYYRNTILNFADETLNIPLKKVFDMRNGYTPSKSNSAYWTDCTIPWFRMDDIRKNGYILKDSLQHVNYSALKSNRLFPANSIIVATSATIGVHALILVPHLANQRFVSLSLKSEYLDKIKIKFIYYYFFLLDEWCCKNVTTSSFASVDMTGFKEFPIPILDIKKQQRLVKILEKFDSLVNDISIGLPAEIEARRKQYEYYRGKLLSFKEINNV